MGNDPGYEVGQTTKLGDMRAGMCARRAGTGSMDCLRLQQAKVATVRCLVPGLLEHRIYIVCIYTHTYTY